MENRVVHGAPCELEANVNGSFRKAGGVKTLIWLNVTDCPTGSMSRSIHSRRHQKKNMTSLDLGQSLEKPLAFYSIVSPTTLKTCKLKSNRGSTRRFSSKGSSLLISSLPFTVRLAPDLRARLSQVAVLRQPNPTKDGIADGVTYHRLKIIGNL